MIMTPKIDTKNKKQMYFNLFRVLFFFN